jgi:hypothetical protein
MAVLVDDSPVSGACVRAITGHSADRSAAPAGNPTTPALVCRSIRAVRCNKLPQLHPITLSSNWQSETLDERIRIEEKAALVDGAFRRRALLVLFAFRPQFRGRPFGIFRFLLNAVYLA